MAITDNIVGCWSPSVRGSGLLLPDLSGRGNHGTLTNMAGDDWVGASARGVSGTVLDFDGTNDHIKMVRPVVFGARWAISAWFAVSNTSQTNRYLLSATIPGNDNSYSILYGYVSQTIEFYSQVAAYRTSSQITVSDTNWHHVVYTQNGEGLRGYLDGVLVASNSATAALPSAVENYIATFNGSGFHFTGRVGEVAFYGAQLTLPQITELYRRGNGAIGRELTGQTRRRVYGFVPAGFKAYWVQQKSRVIGGGV